MGAYRDGEGWIDWSTCAYVAGGLAASCGGLVVNLGDRSATLVVARSAPIAQLAEQETFNLRVQGSSPCGRTLCTRLELSIDDSLVEVRALSFVLARMRASA